MALKDLIKATKADRYTADGRDQLNEALQADVEDRTYKPGDISQKTGLQKQPDGSWAPPKGSSAAKHQKASEKGMSKHWVQKGEKAAFVERTPQEEKEMWKKVAARQSDEKLQLAIKNRQGKDLTPIEKIKLETAKEELEKRSNPAAEGLESKSTEELTNLFNELATKSVKEKSPENSAARDRVYKELKRRQKENQPKAKFDEYGLPDNETISMKEEFLKKEKVADPNKLTNAEFNALAKKLDNELGIGNMELAQELLVTPSKNKPAAGKSTGTGAPAQRSPKEIIATSGKLATQEQTDAATAIADKNSYSLETMMEKFPIQKIQQFANSKVDDFEGGIDEYIEFKAEGRTGVDMEEVGKDFAKLINHNVARRIWNGYTNGSLKVDEKGFFKPAAREESPGDAAPKIRQLTGDCKIKIRVKK